MAKRMSDSEKWSDEWFADLPSKYKLFWLFILDNCHHSGVWKVNFKIANFFIGEHLEPSEVLRQFKSRITKVGEEYWFINKFITYQYNTEIQDLNPSNKLHLSIIKYLNKFENFKPLTSPLLGVKDKDKDKDKEKDKDKVKEISENLKTAKDILLDPRNEQDFELLMMQTKNLNREDFVHFLDQFSLRSEGEDEYFTWGDIKKLRARFKKYILTVSYNWHKNKKGSSNGGTMTMDEYFKTEEYKQSISSI